MESNLKTHQGITLIALVITIIVLLILAGVSIAMLTGDNGILTQAQNAKNKTAEAEAKERQDLEDQNKLIENLASGNNNIKEYHNGVPIPKGFYYVGGEKDTGLVISDKENDDMENSKKGSQFVWIPVEDINKMSQCETSGGNCNLQLVDGILKCTNPGHSSTAEKIVGKLWATEDGEHFGTENKEYTPNSGLREPAIVTGNDTGTGTDYDNNKEYNNGLFTLNSLKNGWRMPKKRMRSSSMTRRTSTLCATASTRAASIRWRAPRSAPSSFAPTPRRRASRAYAAAIPSCPRRSSAADSH